MVKWGRRRLDRARRWLTWYWHVGGETWQIRFLINTEVHRGFNTTVLKKLLTPGFQEKLLAITYREPYRKPTQVDR